MASAPQIELPVGLEPADLSRHLYILGGGPWRLDLQLDFAIKLIRKGYGVCVLDMNGAASKHLLNALAPSWIVDTLYWDFGDRTRHAALNLLEHQHKDDRPLIADTLVSAFQGLFGTDAVGHRSAYILTGAVLALMEVPGTTIYNVRSLLTNERYRTYVREQTKSREAKAFWDYFSPFEKNPRELTAITAPLLNKLGALFLNPRVRNVFAQPRSTVDLSYLMQAGKKIVIINLAEQTIGHRQATLVGNIILSEFQLASRRRLSIPDADRRDFYLIIPDCHHYSEDIVTPLLADANTNLGLIVGSQTVGKRRDEFSHCGSFLAMKCGADDVDLVVSELADVRYETRKVTEGMAMAGRPIYGRTYDAASDEFGAPFHSGVDPLRYARYGKRESIIRHSRERYCRSRSRVERRLSRFAAEWEVGV
jgi:hypothetical protein